MMPQDPNDIYVLKLTFDEYENFAQWITSVDPNDPQGRRRYQLPPGTLKPDIETKLNNYPAAVFEKCNQGPRNFGPQDNVVTHRDPGANKVTNIAIPANICEDPPGTIDLGYLEGYVQDIKNEPDNSKCAWALLGMYFLSRCK
jgi:hypothetical protein